MQGGREEKGGGEKGVWKNMRGGRGMLTNGGTVQPSQQHVTPYGKGVELGLDTRGFGMVAAFWTSIPIEVTQMPA